MFHIQHTLANLVNYMVFTIAESSTLRGKCCDWDGWPGTESGWQCKRGQCIAVAMYTGATVTDCADSVIAASPSPRPTYQIPRRALTFNFCCSTSPPTNCESFINLFFATSDSHLMPDLLDPSWSNCFQANPWSDEMLGIVLWPMPSGYPNLTRYPVFLSIPDPTRFSFGNHQVAGNPKHQVLPDISGITRYFG